MAGLYQLHDRNRFNVFCYSCGPDDGSEYSQRIRQGCDKFLDLQGLNNVKAAERIYDDGVDILVDLMGYTRGNRMEVMALRPAPVQIGYLGFLGTTGADFIDYLVTDRLVTPPEQAAFYSEKFIYMPHSYQINDALQKISANKWQKADFELPETSFVFCSFNNPRKIEPEMFNCWLNILLQLPESVLWLQSGPKLLIDNLRKTASNRQVNADRLIFASTLPLDKHLSRLKLADVALDTGIYNGGATTSNALWAGVPVISKLGTHFVSRMSASSLLALGMPELIVDTFAEYEKLAIELACSEGRLDQLKTKLKRNRETAPFFNTRRFVENLELAYRQVWRTYTAGRSPVPIDVEECLAEGMDT